MLVNGATVCARLRPTQQVADRRVEILGGMNQFDTTTQALTERFQDMRTAPRGIFTLRMVVSVVALLRYNPTQTEDDVQDVLGGVLCQCTGYRKIITAVFGATPVAPGNIGDPMCHVDAVASVSDKHAFWDDIAPIGRIEIFVIRSPYPRADFQLGCSNAFITKTRGIDAVLTAANIPGRSLFWSHSPVCRSARLC